MTWKNIQVIIKYIIKLARTRPNYEETRGHLQVQLVWGLSLRIVRYSRPTAKFIETTETLHRTVLIFYLLENWHMHFRFLKSKLVWICFHIHFESGLKAIACNGWYRGRLIIKHRHQFCFILPLGIQTMNPI